jgi:hypothetical protein
MPIAYIDIVPEYTVVKSKILNDLFWYDIDSKKMHQWKATRLVFSYVNGKLVPSPQVDEKKVYERGDSLNTVVSWAIEYAELGIEILDQDNKEVVIAFPKENEKLIEDLMYSNRFRYEIKNA